MLSIKPADFNNTSYCKKGIFKPIGILTPQRKATKTIFYRDVYTWKNSKVKQRVYTIDNFDYGKRDYAFKDNNGFMLKFGAGHFGG